MDFKITPNVGKVTETLARTAGAKAALVASQLASPTVVTAASRIFQAVDLYKTIFTPFEDQRNPLLGNLTPRQVMEIQAKVAAARPSRKNLFYIRISDPSMNAMGPAASFGLFDLLALDVSYSSATVVGDKVPIGSAVLDKVTGIEAVEIQVTTIDDETGSLKRWFDYKVRQIANGDGTFNVPSSYAFEMEIAHSVPDPHGTTPDFSDEEKARIYSDKYRVRAVSIQHELSRRDQALQELQMTFTQVDTWNQPTRK